MSAKKCKDSGQPENGLSVDCPRTDIHIVCMTGGWFG